jgi:hypothetical protein
MTEASYQIASNPLPPGTRKPGSVGLPSGARVAIMDEKGNLLGSGETGEIVIRGAAVMSGYANRGAPDRASFKDGWFRTGDQGYLDGDGFLFITGRIKEMINRGGEKISPAEIDEVIREHPAVSDAAAFAVPHPTLGEDIAVAVILHESSGATEEELREFVRARLAQFKTPGRVLFVKELPKSATGKPQRAALAEKHGCVPTPVFNRDFVAPRTESEQTLAKIWSQVLRVERVGTEDNFFQLGGDSIRAAQVIARARAAMQSTFSIAAFFERAGRCGGLRKVNNCLFPLRSARCGSFNNWNPKIRRTTGRWPFG